MVRDIKDDVLQERGLILLPLCVRLREIATRITCAVARGMATIVTSCCILSVFGRIFRRVCSIFRCLVLLICEAFVVLCVDAIGFAFVNYSPFIQEIVSVLEGYDFLLLVVIVAARIVSHIICCSTLCVDVSDCISDHVV